ncbi:MAG: hypothetical protein ACLP9C_09685 [Acidimicrobiales bacterium]
MSAGTPPEDQGEPSGPGGPARAVPSAEFLEELAESFRRLRPQGTPRWNFAAAFTQLEQTFGAEPLGLPEAGATDRETGAVAGPPEPAPGQRAVRRAADPIISRVQPWIEARAAAAAAQATRDALAEGTGRVEAGFDATVEALRFLAARVEALEDAAARRTAAIEGSAWLRPPPALDHWAAPVARLLAGAPAGPLVHGECGDGAFAAALCEAGLDVSGCEPRGSLAWLAAARGLTVHVGPVPEYLAGRGAGSLSGLVLSGLVDRLALEDQVALVDLAADRLGADGRLVLIGSRPEVTATGSDAVARDLLPGRPLHPETWSLLLERAGFKGVGELNVAGGGPSDTVAVTGRWGV